MEETRISKAAREQFNCDPNAGGGVEENEIVTEIKRSYFYSGWRVVEEREQRRPQEAASFGQEVVSRQFVDGNGIDEHLQMRIFDEAGLAVEKELYFHQNSRNDTIALTDDNGETVFLTEYTTYGVVFSINEEGELEEFSDFEEVPYLFQGRRVVETSLMYFRNRYYDPGQGRWLQRDPLQYVDSYGLYEAFGGNPYGYSDSEGNELVMWDIFTLQRIAKGGVAVGGAISQAPHPGAKVAGLGVILVSSLFLTGDTKNLPDKPIELPPAKSPILDEELAASAMRFLTSTKQKEKTKEKYVTLHFAQSTRQIMKEVLNNDDLYVGYATGHLGISFGKEKVIYGFHPTPSAFEGAKTNKQVLKILRKKEPLDGFVSIDNEYFANAKLYGLRVGTMQRKVSETLYKTMKAIVLSDIAASPMKHKKYYFPSNQRPINAMKGEFNCISYPLSLKLPLPPEFATGIASSVAKYFK